MRYNLDCIRSILMKLEVCLKINEVPGANKEIHYEHSEIWIKDLRGSMPTFEFADIVYSVEKLEEAGFITIADIEEVRPYPELYRITSITFKGHEFLENIRETRVWDKLKEKLAQAGTAALTVAGIASQTMAVDMITNTIG